MNNYFCVLPFFSAEYQISYKTPCCLLPPNANIDTIRKDMLNGIKSSDCSKCWHLEEQGKTSDRLLQNSAFDYYANRDINLVEDDCKSGAYSEQIVKLYSSNLCNSTCVTCRSAEYSSAWATLLNGPQKKISIEQSNLLTVDWANLKMLSFLGGEPLYEKKNFEVMQKLIEVGNTDCFISFVTNGAVDLSEHQLTILKHFKNLNFCLSIDGIGSVFEYLRYPLSWDLLLKNIKLYNDLNINLSVSYTISNLNILYYKETVDWFNSQGLTYNYNLVTDPDYFNINSLPEQIKQDINFGKELLRTHCSNDDVLFDDLLREIDNQDRMKNISIGDYMPELAKIFDNFRKH